MSAATGRAGLGALAAGAVWLPLCWRLTPLWSSATEQAHGWAVPLLAAYLAAERARRRPATERLGAGGRRLAWAGLGGGLLAYLAWVTILAANPGWPLAQWLAWSAAGAVTLAWAALEGGARNARHFVFPVWFMTTALAWPTAVEVRVVGTLVAVNAQLAAAAVSALGHPAVVSGRVIEVARGLVGVDEACSGVRSLHAVWMAGWFFGELFLLGWGRRLALVGAAGAVAVLGNWMRTATLTWLAAAESPAASAAWHDRVGVFELAGTLVAVAGLALWFGRSATQREPVKAPPRTVTSRRAALAVLAGGVAVALGSAAWYAAHEWSGGAAKIQWRLRPVDAGWRELPVPETARQLLRPSTATVLARDSGPAGRTAYALVVTWEGDGADAVNAEAHDPTICLPASGVAAPERRPPLELEIAGVPLELDALRFTAAGEARQVFFCHWDAWLGRARPAQPQALVDVPRWRLERAWAGRRRGDVAYVAFVVPGADEEAARAWVRRWAPELLRRR